MRKPKAYSSAALKKQILADAKSLQIAEKWAETIAAQTVKHVDTWIRGRGTVTETDIARIAYQKLENLNPDLAYIFKNRGNIL
jgi:hypothetical protein